MIRFNEGVNIVKRAVNMHLNRFSYASIGVDYKVVCITGGIDKISMNLIVLNKVNSNTQDRIRLHCTLRSDKNHAVKGCVKIDGYRYFVSNDTISFQ